MPITVTMIEEKEFKTKVRGYDPVEVDEFLDEICDEMIAMQDEITGLQNRLSQANTAPAFAPVPAPVMAPPVPMPAVNVKAQTAEASESAEAAKKLLANAQRVYDQTIADAKKEAAEIISGAKQSVPKDVTDMEEKRRELKEQIEQLKASAREYRQRFDRLIEDQKEILESEDKLFE